MEDSNMSTLQQLDRSSYIGGSDVAAILGVSPWQSAFMLYQKKLGLFQEEITEAKQKIFDRGHRWEPIVVEMLVDELKSRGHDVQILARNQRYKDAELPFLAAEIDLELLIDGEEVNAEAKTVSPYAVKEWGVEDSDDVPIYYAAQVMHGLMIKPRKRAVVAALTGFDDKPRIHWIERDDETIHAIRTREIEFWNRLQNREAPDPETIEDVQFLYKKDKGLVIEADDELASLVIELKNEKQRRKHSEAQEEMLATKIKLLMGDAAVAMHNGKPICTWKNNKDSVKTDWRAMGEYLNAPPETIAKFQSTHPGARVLLLK